MCSTIHASSPDLKGVKNQEPEKGRNTIQCKREETGHWKWPLLSVAYRRHGTKGDNETLSITIGSDRQDDESITVVGTLEIECLAVALRELADKLS